MVNPHPICEKMQHTINWRTTIHIFKLFQREPLKVFVKSDFTANNGTKTHLRLLERLGLIEKIPAKYRVKHGGYREIQGYKLRNRTNDKTNTNICN